MAAPATTTDGVLTLSALYQYQPIDPKDEIRILTISPPASSDPVTLHCELFTAKLSDKPSYEALSYCWGANVFPETLYLPGGVLAITENLAAGLRQLRHPEQHRHLWVDAVCINQGDLSERSEQVRQMIDIYRHAQGTLVWLGEWPDSTYPHLTPDSIRNFLHRAVELSRANEMSYNSIILHHDGFSCYMQIAELLESVWFTRVWVLQEAAVAREVTFVCGQITFSWDILIEGFLAIGNMKDPPHFISAMKRWYEIHLKAVTFCRRYFQDVEYRQDFSRAPLPDRLLSLLLLSSGQAATDQRDYLYALLGLAGQAEEMQQETSLTVDYQREPEEVLTRLAVYLLKSTQDLSILYGANYQTVLDVPSWVPTWRGNRLWNLARYFDPRMPLLRLPDDTRAKIFFSCDEKSIMIKGYLVGHVTDVGRPAEKEARDRQSAKALFEDWERDILRPLDKNFPYTCIRALVGDAVAHAKDTDCGFTAMGVWCQTLFHSKGWDEESNDDGNNLEALLYTALLGRALDKTNLERLDTLLDLFCTLEVSRLHGGAPFATSSGLFGFFDKAVLLEQHPNATLCIFQGCVVPFILRGGPEEYTLLGPCYLQPFMTLKTAFGYPDWITLI